MGIDGKQLRRGVVGWDSQESCKGRVVGEGGIMGWELPNETCRVRVVVSVGLVGWASGSLQMMDFSLTLHL